MDIAEAYRTTWSFAAPRSCRAMHDAKLFDVGQIDFAVFEVYTPEMIAEGDAFVTEMLVPGLVPIGGDRSGDRWCFDAREKIHGTTPVVSCPHDGGGATFVAPSFAGFVYRLILENLALAHLLEGWGKDRAAIRAITLRNLELAEPWLLRRWARKIRATLDGEWPREASFDAFVRTDPAFARLPREPFEHFRRQ